MLPFSSRPRGYRAGVILLFLATIIYLVGCGAPYWASEDYWLGPNNIGMAMSTYNGLWTVCVTVVTSGFGFGGFSTTTCTAYEVNGLASDFHVARALSCFCLIGLLVCCFYAALTNCTNCVASSSYPLLEIGSTLAGLLGFFGCLVFAAFKAGSRGTSLGSLMSGMPGMPGMSGMSGMSGMPGMPGMSGGGLGTSSRSPSAAFGSTLTLDWGFYLAAVGCALTIIAVVVISLSNKPGATRGAEGPAAIPMTTISVGQGQGLPVYQGQGQGLGPPVYQIQGQGQYYYHQGQGQQFNQGQGQVLAIGQGQGQVHGTGQPLGLGTNQFSGAPQDPKSPRSGSQGGLELQEPDAGSDSTVEKDFEM